MIGRSLWLALGLIGCSLSAGASELAIGDSVAVGLKLPGDAKVGRSPRQVVSAIAATPLKQLHGSIVILSTGLSNDPSQAQYVPVQLAMLRAAGAKVIMLGVGDGAPNAVEINNWLTALADDTTVAFLWGWPGVHPPDYSLVLWNARQMECYFFHVCGA